MKILLLFLLVVSFVRAQNYNIQERQFFELQSQYISQLQKIDSLKNKLDILLIGIEQLKKNDSENRNEISARMAEALEQSEIIDRNESELNMLERKLTQKRRILYSIYTLKIDSLENLNQHSTDNRTLIESELRDFNIKRLYVSPLLMPISFDPKLVEEIQLSDSGDDKQKKIYKEYLDNALSEVDSNIYSLQKKSENIRLVMKLNEQTEDFMDDIEADLFSGAFVVNEQSSQRSSILGSEYDNFTAVLDLAKVTRIYNRLSPFLYDNYSMQDNSLQDSLYTEDYLDLLIETEKTLRLYREKIRDKLD